MNTDRRVLLIGLDGMLAGLVRRFRGSLPHTDRLIREGVFAEALACQPTDTPTNWTTIATGADTATHGVRGFPVGPTGKAEAHFDSRRCKAEFVWEALERAGKQAILLNYPTSWPVRTERITVVGGDGVFSPTWRIGDLVHYSTELDERESGRAVLFDVCRTDVRIELKPAEGWASMPASAQPPLEVQIPSIERKAASWSDQGFVGGEPETGAVSGQYSLLLTASNAGGYDTVTIASGKDAAEPICRLRAGEWSGWVFADFPADGEMVRGSFRFKLIELSPDGRRLRLYRTMVSAAEGWTHPPELAAELVEAVGPYHEGWENSPMEMAADLGVETLVEHAQHQADWLARAARHLAAREHWHLMMAQVHIQDSYNHRFLRLIEPWCEGYEAGREAWGWSLFERLYQITDRMIGEIVDGCADENTTVILVSDHGCFPVHTRICAEAILAKAGLLEVRCDADGKASIVREASRLTPRSDRSWLETARLRDEAISLLTSVRDPRTGICPFAAVLGRDEVPLLGPGARCQWEVAWFLKAGYTPMPLPRSREAVERMLAEDAFYAPCGQGTHRGLPTTRFKDFGDRATFIISGAGIAAGAELPSPVSLKDVTPTICHLLGIAPPKHSEGRIVWEALREGHSL